MDPDAERKYSFVVDSDSSEEGARDALLSLRRTIKLGKLAERALLNIKTHGHHNGRVLVMSGKPGYGSDISEYRFPQYIKPTRETVPGYGQYEVILGNLHNGIHGDAVTKEVLVILKCQGWSAGSWDPVHLKVGNARVKTSDEVVFVHDRTWGPDLPNNRTISKLYTRATTEKALEAYKEIAVTLACNIIRFNQNDIRNQSVPQVIFDTRKILSQWLIEDGFIEEFCQRLRRTAHVAMVMDS